MMQAWENDQNSNFRPSFGPPKIFPMGFTSTGSFTMFQAIILCNFKENLYDKKPNFKPEIGPPIFYFFLASFTSTSN